MQHIGLLGGLLLLILCTIEDIRKKEIVVRHLSVILPFLIVDILINTILHTRITGWERVGGCILGGVFVVLSKLTRGKIGLGDSYIILILGILLGGFRGLEIITYSFFASAICSIILMVFVRYGRNKTIPFIPFLLFGFLVSIFFGGGSIG